MCGLTAAGFSLLRCLPPLANACAPIGDRGGLSADAPVPPYL